VSRLAERAIIKLARIVAGPERRQWVDAIEAELDHLPAGRLDWALGSLVAAVKDRVGRDWPFGLALGVLPGFAVVAVFVSTAAIAVSHKQTGLPPSAALLAQILAPLPFAWLLGRVRPAWPTLAVGAAGFLAYQIMPWAAWHALVGPGVWLFWGPTLTPLGLPLPLVLPSWLAGAWWGATAARRARRKRLSPRSP
jgi:hypothetical protein